MKNALAAIGISSWSHIIMTTRYPDAGEQASATFDLSQVGGTAAHCCATLGLLGLYPTLISCVGDDDYGELVIDTLRSSGCDVRALRRKSGVPTDRSVIIAAGSGISASHTTIQIRGARPATRERLPVSAILDHRWLLLDVDDHDLRAFWLELPAHSSPRTRLIGTTTYLVDMAPPSGWRQALHHDVMIGGADDLIALTDESTLNAAVGRAQADLPGNACNVIYVTAGQDGALSIRSDRVTRISPFQDSAIASSAVVDAFTAGCIWGMMEHLEDHDILWRANLLAGTAWTQFGAGNRSLTREQILAALDRHPLRASDA